MERGRLLEGKAMTALSGKKGLIIGIANEHSLASRCAGHFRAAGAELAITYINAKTEPYVRPLARGLQSEIFMPCDVTAPGQLEAVFGRIAEDWGRLDFVQDSIAYARKEDLSGRITDCSADGFAIAMNAEMGPKGRRSAARAATAKRKFMQSHRAYVLAPRGWASPRASSPPSSSGGLD